MSSATKSDNTTNALKTKIIGGASENETILIFWGTFFVMFYGEPGQLILSEVFPICWNILDKINV